MEIDVEKKSWVHIMINQKKLDNVECLNYLGSLITRDWRCTPEIKSRIFFNKSHIEFEEGTKLDLSRVFRSERLSLRNTRHTP